MILIAAVAIILSSKPTGISSAIPILGVLALGSQRLLPLIQQVYYGWSTIKGAQKQLQDILDLLNQSVLEPDLKIEEAN